MIPPPIDRPPIRQPLYVNDKQVVIGDGQPWGKFFIFLYEAVRYLLDRPQILGGLLADIPDPTLLPEFSQYTTTDTLALYSNFYATPGDPTTAVWTVIP